MHQLQPLLVHQFTPISLKEHLLDQSIKRDGTCSPRECRCWCVPMLVQRDAFTFITTPAWGQASRHEYTPLRSGWSCYAMALAQWQPLGTVCPHQPAGQSQAIWWHKQGSALGSLARLPREGGGMMRGEGAACLPVPWTWDATSKESLRSLQWGAFLPAPQCCNKSLRAEMLLPLLALPDLPSHVFLACEESWRRFCEEVSLQHCSFLL